jgi:hypothetical protein
MSNDYYEEYLAKTNDNLRESTLLKQEKKKPSSKKAILLTLLVLVLAGEGFYLWQKNQEVKSDVDNPTEALLPMTKPTIILDTNHSVEKNTTKPVVKVIPKTKVIEKNITKPIVKVVPKTKVIEKNVTKPIVQVIPKINSLEESLLEAKDTNKSTMKNGKKIDTFNKIIIDITVSKGSEISQKISQILKDAKKKKEEIKKELKEKKKVIKKKKTSNYTNAINKEAKVRKDEMRYVTVRSGDSLYKIAKRIYGDSSKFEIIFKANSDILKKATDLSIGQKLRVPKLKKGK